MHHEELQNINQIIPNITVNKLKQLQNWQEEEVVERFENSHGMGHIIKMKKSTTTTSTTIKQKQWMYHHHHHHQKNQLK